MGCHLLGMGGQSAFARGPFTVLFVMAVLRHEIRRRQGNDLCVSGANNYRCDGRMIIKRLASAELTGEAVWAVNGFRRKVVGAIERHEELIAKDTKRRQQALLFQALQNRNKHRIERARHEWIEELADLIVTGNLLHASQRLGVIVTFAVLQSALVLQKRRGLGEKDAKGAQGGILDSISCVGTRLAMVRQLTDLSVQDVLENIEA